MKAEKVHREWKKYWCLRTKINLELPSRHSKMKKNTKGGFMTNSGFYYEHLIDEKEKVLDIWIIEFF